MFIASTIAAQHNIATLVAWVLVVTHAFTSRPVFMSFALAFEVGESVIIGPEEASGIAFAFPFSIVSPGEASNKPSELTDWFVRVTSPCSSGSTVGKV